MNILMINSTQKGLDIELKTNSDYYQVHVAENLHSEIIMVKIDEILQKAKIVAKDIDVVAVCVGPGSFTGIRVSLAVAKGFYCATDVKLVSFNTFELFSYNNLDADVVIAPGFSAFCYCKYDNKEECLEDEKVKEIVIDKKVICDNEMANHLGVKNNILPNKSMCELVLDKISRKNFTEIKDLDAVYLRLSQAEITRVGKNG